MGPEYFLMLICAVAAVGAVYSYIAYRREKASPGEAPAVLIKSDWLSLGIAMLVFVVVACWLLSSIANSHEKENQRPVEEKLSTEEFSYKEHQYIIFRTNSRLDGASVVHAPNCECQIKKDSI